MRLSLCLFALASAAYNDQHDSRTAIHTAIGDARYQSNHKYEDLYRPATAMEDSITRHPTLQPTDGFQGHTGAITTTDTPDTFPPTKLPTSFPTKAPTVGPTKDQGGCNYATKTGTIVKSVGWAGPGALSKYCNKWTCNPNTSGSGGVWSYAGIRECAIQAQTVNGVAETACIHTQCIYDKTDPVAIAAQNGDLLAKHHGDQARNSIYNEIDGIGVMKVQHDHRETKRNHRCRHDLNAGVCGCFCHGDIRRQDEAGFRRVIHDINRDYAGLTDYVNHRDTRTAGRNAYAGSSHTRADEHVDFVGDRQGEYWNDQQTGTLNHPHYQDWMGIIHGNDGEVTTQGLN